MKKWTPAFELSYWNANSDDEYYIANIRQKYHNFFHVDYWLNKFPLIKKCAIDIGGGKFGGGLRFLNNEWTKVLVDRLAQECELHVPADIITINSDFGDVNVCDNIASVIFAWNVFDHANDKEHFQEGMSEVGRLLSPCGLFFGSFPMRTKPRDGHPFCLYNSLVINSVNEISKCEILWKETIGNPHYSDETLFLIARRHD